LSVTHIFGEDGHSCSSSTDRGLVALLTKEELSDMLREHEQRYSACSETDEELGNLESYGSKSVKNWSVGNRDQEFRPFGFGYACHKGKKPESPNQDSWFMMQVEGVFAIYAVFDGHGQGGHYVSNYVKENLPKLIVRDSRLKSPDERSDMLRDAFRSMQGMIGAATLEPPKGSEPLTAKMAGTTATVVLHDHEAHSITVAHVGDSGVCMATKDPLNEDGPLVAEMLTKDHKPGLQEEKDRIMKAGGTVVFDGYANHRVFIKGTTYPGLNMSRCLGDLVGHSKAGISAVPDVVERQLHQDSKLLLLCSDGVWEFMKPKEVVDLVSNYGPDRAGEAAEALAQESWNRWITEERGGTVDDITALIIDLRSEVTL